MPSSEPISISRLSLAVLAGGESKRMGSPKYLLTHSDGTPVYLNRLKMLREAFPDAQSICLVLKDLSQAQCIEIPSHLDIDLLFNATTRAQAQVNGPAAGMHAAYQFDPTSHWLILPCDYPFLEGDELRGLCQQYQHPVTCFENGQRITEPLVAIWSPEALAYLSTTTIEDRSGLSALIEQLRGKCISPAYDHSFFNTNTREEWDDALRLL